MGWFDDDDDEDEEQEKRNRKRHLDLMTPLDQEVANVGNTNQSNTEVSRDQPAVNDVDASDEDPLESYMKQLAAQPEKERGATRNSNAGTRLDVENEEEATSHWESQREKTDETATATSSSSSLEASVAMQQMFHKASTDQAARQVNIQLDRVQHCTMEYATFRKQLLSVDTDNSASTPQGHDWRRQNSISCHPPLDPVWEFAELRETLPDEVLEWIRGQEGMTKPTLVQAQTLSVVLGGLDAIVTAPTGSGKTLAYLLPLVAHLVENNSEQGNTSCRALVLVPTRELALQVEKVAKNLLSRLPFSALAITGGNMGRYQLGQTLLKQRPHLIVATPGRLLDVLSSQQKSKQEWLLREITFLVMDEADKMLQLGFAAQVSQLLENLRPDRQSMLTSATFHGRLEKYCQEWMHMPTRIGVGRSGVSSEHVEQHVLSLPNDESKIAFLKESLPTFCDVGRTIVFCAKRDGCEQLATVLMEVFAPNELQTLHGDKHPSDRKAALRAFAKGDVKLLVATDVAGRGLDIPDVSTVINYNPAKNWDTHVHRIGRAGRLNAKAGGERQKGSAYTLLTPSDAGFAQILVQAYKREGRTIAEDLLQLSFRSKQNYGGSQRKGGKAGLGYVEGSAFPPTTATPFESRKKPRWSDTTSS
eukprot:Nitzschia sp. Nitz4//scaffold17_size182527//2166//4106//NITZ4_001824-RA/size182527-processed-gene-0.35-mRNA-1//-1//CDS//3329539250//1418//frame0